MFLFVFVCVFKILIINNDNQIPLWPKELSWNLEMEY
jgi:hypothetical protein